MICVMGEDGWCERHRRAHAGRLRELAGDPGVRGERYRRLWDREEGFETPPGTALVTMSSSGLGDALLGLTAAAGLRRQNPRDRVVYAVHPHLLGWVRRFDAAHEYVDVHSPPPADLSFSPYAASYAQELQEGGRRPRWVYYASCCDTEAVLPGHTVPPETAAWAENYRDAVLLAPWANWGSRAWSEQHWLALEDALLARGARTAVLDNQTDRTHRFRSGKILGLPPEYVMAAVGVAAYVVSADSGMAHLGGIMGTRTLVLCGPSRGEQIYGLYPRARWLSGGLPCSGCYWQGERFTPSCNQSCASLQTVLPGDVLAALGLAGGPASPPPP